MSGGHDAPPEATPQAAAGLEQAWKILQLVDEWIRHAETKLAATLVAAGVSGGALFNLVRAQDETSLYFDIVAVLCCTAVILSGVAAMVGLYPVLKSSALAEDDEVNLVFFGDIDRAHRIDASGYRRELHALTAHPDELARHLNRQIHANSVVAGKKFRWATFAIRSLLVELLALGGLAMVIALGL